MGRKKVVSVRLDKEIIDLIRQRHGSLTRLIREAIKEYTENPTQQLSDDIENLLSEFKARIENYIQKVKQFCEEHAKEITSIHESEKDKYEYWRDMCLHRYRTITRHNLNVYITDKLLPRITQKLDGEQKTMLEKRINRIIEDAVNEIYSSHYPPVYPI